MGNDFFKTPSGNTTILIDKEILFTLFLRVNIHEMEPNLYRQLIEDVRKEAERRMCTGLAVVTKSPNFSLSGGQLSHTLAKEVSFWLPDTFWYYGFRPNALTPFILLYEMLPCIEKRVCKIDEDEICEITKMDLSLPCLKITYMDEVIHLYIQTEKGNYKIRFLHKSENVSMVCQNVNEIEEICYVYLADFYRKRRLLKLFD